MKIDFSKIIKSDFSYSLDVKLEVINWFLKTGNSYDEFTSKWTKDGVSKQMFGYCANSYGSCANVSLPIKCDSHIGYGSHKFIPIFSFVQNCFVNILIKNHTKPVKKWLDAEKIGLGKSRFLSFCTDYPVIKHPKFDGIFWSLTKLKDFINMPLKKELFHTSYPKRNKPKIIDIAFYTNGNGYIFEYIYSFKIDNYEDGWRKFIQQEEKESLNNFLNRIFFEMDKVIIQ